MSSKVFVLNWQGKPLMPTTPRKARVLLNTDKAMIVRYDPFFTIQLKFGSSGYRQPIKLGPDPGHGKIGVVAITPKTAVLEGELALLEGLSERLKERAMYRRQRRQRLRFRAPRFDNRRKPEGWLAPSIQHKYDSHCRLIERIQQILPLTDITIEVANFDIQKIKNPQIQGVDYQHGEQYDSWNVREYVLHRDTHSCQNPDCKNPTDSPILQVHHLGYWQGDRTDRPANLITLCIECHTPANHHEHGFLYGWQPQVRSFKPETFMTTIRWRLVNAFDSHATYGYLTKRNRKQLDLPKTHVNDAFVIAGGQRQQRTDPLLLEQNRRNNRSLEKFYDAKYIDTRTGRPASGQVLFNGRRTRNKQLNEPNLHHYRGYKLMKGRVAVRTQHYPYQPHDLVMYHSKRLKVKGVQNYGAYVKLEGLAKPVKTSLVSPLRRRKGICRMV